MKKTFMLAGFATIVLACNNNSDNNTNKSDSADQSAHLSSVANKQTENNMNPVTETMDRMMHQMHGATPTENNDIDFTVMMVEHHKGAVEMSKVEIGKGKDAELKAFAGKVINGQEKEIKFMQDLISKTSKTKSPGSEAFQEALNHSMMAMMNGNTTIYNDIDKDFAAQMMPHHQSAVDMAEAYLKFGKETRLRKLCRDIIDTQAKEIAWLKQWLAKHTAG